MRLKNKKTGEIKEFALFDGNELQGGVTLEILTKEWEDYEEPNLIPDQIFLKGSRVCIDYKNAEAGRKALEKLKAWKRLKDKGFRFCSWFYDIENQEIKIKAEFKEFEEVIVGQKRQDLDLLFSQEDD